MRQHTQKCRTGRVTFCEQFYASLLQREVSQSSGKGTHKGCVVWSCPQVVVVVFTGSGVPGGRDERQTASHNSLKMEGKHTIVLHCHGIGRSQ